MADNNDNVSALRAELNSLAGEVSKIIKNLEDKKSEYSDDLAARVAKEVNRYRSMASDEANKLYKAGQAQMDEVGEHVRKNPLTSLLVAFGAGCVISCLFRHLR